MLPAPIIEGTLPAFYFSGDIATITVPFSMSRAVNRNEVKGFKLKIKNLQGSSYLLTLTTTMVDYVESTVTFTLDYRDIEENARVIKPGVFYKAQLAYYSEINNQDVAGYYSTVGIIKCTEKPVLSILGLSTSKNNSHTYTYTGVYSQENRDPTEKIYAYRFVIKDNEGNVVEDTDYLIHNSSIDVEFDKSSDVFTYTYDLALNEKYTITYFVKTNNGLEVEGPTYKIVQKEAIPLDTISKIYPVVDYENGIIEIFFNVNPNPQTQEEIDEAYEDKAKEGYIKGTFILSRSSEDYQYQNWETIVQFGLFSQKPSSQTWKDFTIEQGKNYKYAIQQYSKANQLYSKRLISEPVMADFEDSFLYDGSKQLKIKFNPKVASFKKNIFEAKIDTLGSKYPFIFRNGQVEYKEFPISGLISYLMDEQSLFGNNSEQFMAKERENIEIYSPYTWLTHPNAIVEKTLQRKQYQKEYRFLYVWDSASQAYIKWVDYLEIQNGTNSIEYNKYQDYSDYDKYFDPNKQYYSKSTEEVNRLDLDNIKLKTTNEVSYNLSLERDFKMEVLNWLTNGEPKLFRSPTEGNFIVRLMNVSLTPNDQLGRMLHTFNSTAYEIADFSYETLKEFGFLNTQYFKSSYFKIQTIPLITNDKNYVALSNIEYNKISSNPDVWQVKGPLMPAASTLDFIEITDAPGSIFEINGETIAIGASGYYKVELPVYSLSFISSPPEDPLDLEQSGMVTYGYYTDIDDTFSYLSNVEIKEICGRQFIGPQHENIVDKLKDFITTPLSYYLVRSWKKRLVSAKTDEEGKDTPLLPDEKIEDYVIMNIDLYKYLKETDENLGNLYKQVYFTKTEFYDSMYTESLAREREYRATTNVSLNNEKDYVLYLITGKLFKYNSETDSFEVMEDSDIENETFEGPFFIQRQIEYIHDPMTSSETRIYLSKSSYQEFKDFYREWAALNPNGENYKKSYQLFLDNYRLMNYTITIQIDDNSPEEKIDLTETKYHQLKDFSTLKSYKTSEGVYSDFTYNVQIIDYDISKQAELIAEKQKVDAYLDIMSYDCIQRYIKDLSTYQMLLEGARNGFKEEISYTYEGLTVKLIDSYEVAYQKYLTKLKAYVESLEEFNKEA